MFCIIRIVTKLYRTKFRANSGRLKGYDYSLPRHYFVTICTKGKKHYFGKIENWEMKLSWQGKVIKSCWINLPKHYPNCILDEYVIMPNHFHSIIHLDRINIKHVGAGFKPAPTQNYSKPYSLSEIIRAFKTFSARQINIKQNTQGRPFWQRNYYDRIIRNHYELECVRKYIRENPQNWDQLNNKTENISNEIKKLYSRR